MAEVVIEAAPAAAERTKAAEPLRAAAPVVTVQRRAASYDAQAAALSPAARGGYASQLAALRTDAGPAVQRQEAGPGGARAEENGPSGAAGTLDASTNRAIDALMKGGDRQGALDAMVKAAAAVSGLDTGKLVGGKMVYDASIKGEGQVRTPGYTKEGGPAKLSKVLIGAAAYAHGVPWLYSSVYANTIGEDPQGRPVWVGRVVSRPLEVELRAADGASPPTR